MPVSCATGTTVGTTVCTHCASGRTLAKGPFDDSLPMRTPSPLIGVASMFIREWGQWGRRGRRCEGGTCPLARRPPWRAPSPTTGDPHEIKALEGSPPQGSSHRSPHPDESCGACHGMPVAPAGSPPQGSSHRSPHPDESRGARHGKPAGRRSPLPRLCQYLEPHGSRPAA